MKERIAIITGASSGIGKAVALALAASGVRLILNGRDEKKLSAVSDLINEKAGTVSSHIVSGDITDRSVTADCIGKCISEWNTAPDIFIASAGRGLPGTLITSDSGEWDRLIDTNVKGLMFQLNGIARSMVEQATARDFVNAPLDIVVIGSSIGRNVSPFNSVYGATKFATHGLTEALRRELGPQGIRVTLIEPGLVGTNFQSAAGYDLQWFEKYSNEVGPILTAENIAEVIRFSISLPGNVHLDNISIRPTRQAYP